jgi:ankyrin repeat protein
MLLDNGAYVDAIDHEGNTPLLVAVNRGHLEISSLLLAIGSNANTINKVMHAKVENGS